MMEWLNQNANAVGAMASIVNVLLIFVLVGATIYYAKATNKISEDTKRQAEASVRMAEEMKKTSELTYRPELALYHLPRKYTLGKHILLVIENVGSGPATNVKVECWWRGGYYVEGSDLSLGGRDRRNFRCDYKGGTAPDIPQLREEVRQNDLVVQLNCQDLNGKPVGPWSRRVIAEQMP